MPKLDINKTISYALRRLSATVTRRNAQTLLGTKEAVDMPALKEQIMEIADAVDGVGKRKWFSILPFVLKDAAGTGDPVQGYVTYDGKAIAIFLKGFSHKNGQNGAGYPIGLELYEGVVRLVAWDDINRHAPSHVIDLSGAAEANRLPEKVWQYLDERFVEAHKNGGGLFYTTRDYWDCECKQDYIHHREVESCPVCGVKRWDGPDARVLEVVEMLEKRDGRKS